MQTGHLLCSVSAFFCETRDFQSNINNNLNCYFYERINKNFLFPSLLHIRDCINDAMRCSNFCRLKYFRCAWAIAYKNSRHFATPPLFSAKWRLRNERRNSILMTRHYPDLCRDSWLAEANFPRGTTNQKHYPDLCSAASSLWNFCARFSDLISQGNQWWHCEMKAVFSGYTSQGDPVFSPRLWRM